MTLTAADLETHRRLGITATILEQMHVRRVDDREAREVLSINGRPGNLGGILYPYLDPVHHRALGHRLRRDFPEVENGKPKAKYLSGYGDRRHLYFAVAEAASLLADVAVLVVFLEAEKSVLSVTCAAHRLGRRVLAVGLGGCWGWRGRIGKVETATGGRADEVGPLPDLDRIAWPERVAVIVFDANATTNPSVQAARRAFTTELERRGATVRVVDFPIEPGINGPDDFIGRHGDAAFFALLDTAAEVRGVVPLGRRDPQSGRLVLSTTRTLPTAEVYVQAFYHHPDGRCLHHHADVLLAWRDNRYLPIEDAAVKCQLQTWLHGTLRYVPGGKSGAVTLAPFDSNPATVASALESIRAYVHLPATIASPSWLDGDPHRPALEILPCRSMNVHVPTATVLPATPALFTLNALAFDYDEAASPPLAWFEFLTQLWGDDTASIALLQEWFGDRLIADTSQQKILLLVGPRRSGKGTIGRILSRLVGITNVVGPTTSSLAGAFGLQPLIGKSLAIVSDARFTGESVAIVVERLLCISGEDTLTIDRKFLGAISMRLSTRFLFLTNELPRLNDASTALAGRFLILRLVRSFYGEEDPTLTDRLTDELPGILLWAIEGWVRLQERGHFVQPPSVADAIEDLEDLASPVRPFVRECCTVLPALRVPVDALYAAWEMWCQQTGRKATTRQLFGRDLASAVPAVKRRRSTDLDPFYDGIGITAATANAVDRFQKARQRTQGAADD